MKNNLVEYYTDEVPLALEKTVRGLHAAINYRVGMPSAIHYYYAKVGGDPCISHVLMITREAPIICCPLSQTGKCKLYIMSRGYMGPSCLNLMFPKGSPLTKRFDPVYV